MLRRLIHYMGAHKTLLAVLLITMLASTVVEMLSPWPLKFIVDNVLGHHPFFGQKLDQVSPLVLLVTAALSYLILAALRGLFGFLRRRWMTEVSQKASLALRSDLYAQLQKLSLNYHERARVGDLVTRLTSDVTKLQDAFIDALSLFSVELVTVVGIIIIMFAVDWQFALLSLLVLPPLFLIHNFFRHRIRQASREVRSSEGGMASVAQEVLSSIRLVKAFGQEQREQDRFVSQSNTSVEASVRAANWEGLFSWWVEIITAVGMAIILGYGGWRVSNGDLTLGQMLLFMQYLNILYTPLRRLSRLTSIVQKAAASAERLEELFRQAPEVPEQRGAVPLAQPYGQIVFNNVWFGYNPERPVLKGINLAVNPGEIVAIMGPTGDGKSTLASLIPRFYDPLSGSITIGGTDLRQLQTQSLREQIALVPQDTILFSGTIRDNITYSRPGASESEVIEAAQAAHAHEFIMSLPQGYESHVGERGVNLSGGQRQRISIARALLKNAPILILDEPTSSVDNESEGLIRAALQKLVQGRTTIIITHRPSLSYLAHRIVVLQDGRIAWSGSRDQLQAGGILSKRFIAS